MTLRLHQTFGAHTGRSYSFDKDVVRVGRMPDCDVSFDPHADLDASGRHAEFRREPTGWTIVDSGSRNGTWVNGQRVDRRVLVQGDEVEFGPGGPRLRVELPPDDVATARARPGAETEASTPVGFGAATGPMTGVPQTTPPPPMTPAHAPPQKKYGERTVGLMIRDALDRAGASRGLKIAVVVLSLALGVTLAVLGYLVVTSPKPGEEPDSGHIAAANAGALYRLVEVQQGTERSLCTGFAVRARVVATTARCVLAIESRRAAGASVELRGLSGPVGFVRMYRHPSFEDGSEGADVGLIQIDADAPSVVSLTTIDQLHSLEEGDPLLIYGFSGGIARTTQAQVDELADAPQARVLRHSSSAAAGAPAFLASGAVVGLHSTGVSGTEPTPEGAGYVVGADAILALLLGLPQ